MLSFVRIACALTLITALSVKVAAQTAPTPQPSSQSPVPSPKSSLSLVQIAPYAGYYYAGNLADGPLGTSLSGGSGPLYGMQLAVPITKSLSLLGNAAYADGNLRVGVPILGGFDVGSAKTWLFDGGIQLNAPTLTRGRGALVPFAQAGVGAARHAIDVSGLSSRSTNFVWNAGLGVDVALGSSVGLRLLAKDYVGKFDMQEATGFDVSSKSRDNWSFVAGLTFTF